jgi:hypothetical protein
MSDVPTFRRHGRSGRGCAPVDVAYCLQVTLTSWWASHRKSLEDGRDDGRHTWLSRSGLQGKYRSVLAGRWCVWWLVPDDISIEDDAGAFQLAGMVLES